MPIATEATTPAPPAARAAPAIVARQHLATAADGHRLVARLWPAVGEARSVVVVLHGVVGHSGWFHLWAPRLAARGVTVLAPDRRGSGLDTAPPGDALSLGQLLGDLESWLEAARELAPEVHLCGFCWGSNYAASLLGRGHDGLASLMLLAPGIFPAERLLAVPLEEGESGEARVPVPLRPEDFTRGPLLGSYLRPDPLRLEKVSPRFVAIQRRMSAFLPARVARAGLPTLVVVGDADEVSDNRKMRRLFDRHLGEQGRWRSLEAAHGLVFEAPCELAEICAEWVGAVA